MTGSEVGGIRWMMSKHIQPNSLRRYVDSQATCGHSTGIADGEFRSAMCSVQPIQKDFHRLNFTVDGSWNTSLRVQPLQRYYCENSGSPASACVMRRHYSYHVHAVASRNKLFTSCKTSGKLNLWRPRISTLLLNRSFFY